MKNYELDNQLKTLSSCAYKENFKMKPKDWISVKFSQNKKTGFYAEAFYKNGQIVISYKGTDDINDIINDLSMGFSYLPIQVNDARNFYEQIKKDFPKQKIILTGHSLGGSLAQIVGSETGEKTVTFEAFGIKNTLNPNVKYSNNIINYGHIKDPVFISNINNQIGKTYVIGDFDENDGFINKSFGYDKNLNLNYHYLENIGDISKSTEYDKDTPLGQTILKASIEYNKYKNTDRIFTREDIKNMTSDEYLKNEKAINSQLKTIGIPTENEMKEQVKSGNMIWIESYTRDDGTVVKGYYRSRPKE